jgi:hypothetical protein
MAVANLGRYADGMTEGKMPADYWTNAEVMKGIFETKVCLAKAHSPDACDGKIIAAHTIPRSQLSKIAIDGHVYAVAATHGDLARNDGKLTAKKRGISQFSVLNCFCAAHDKKIFAHVEDDALVFDPHQLTLLHYRTLASELYRVVSAYIAGLHQIEEQQKKKPVDQETIKLLKVVAAGQLPVIRDVGTAFERCAKNLFASKYDDVTALVVHFKKLPSVMTVGSFLPQYDYDAKPIQLINDTETLAQTVSFNILVSQDHAALAMVWFKDHDLVRLLAESFIAQNAEHYATLAIQTAFEYLETTCMQPKWWEGEKPVVQDLVLERMGHGTNPLDKRKAHCLTFCGVGFDQWEYDRHEFLNVDEAEEMRPQLGEA